MKNNLFFLLLITFSLSKITSLELKSDGFSRIDTYQLIKNIFGDTALEDNPDQWYIHNKVKHITEDTDKEIGNFFRLVVHRDADIREKEINKIIYRFNNTSIKMFDPADKNIIAYQWYSIRYRWKMKINSDISVSAVPTRFFEIYALNQGGPTKTARFKPSVEPDEFSTFSLITLETVKKEGKTLFQLTKKLYKDTPALILSEIDFDKIKGRWLELELTLKFNENGYIKYSLKEHNGQELMFYEKYNTKMLYERSYEFFYPTWGLIRDVTDKNLFSNNEEEVLLADFNIEMLNSDRNLKEKLPPQAQNKPDKNKKVNEPVIEENKVEQLKGAKEGEVIIFNDIIFYPDVDTIKQNSYSVLDKIANVLNERKNLSIEIGGYTNSTGKPDEELMLSTTRAMKVAMYLIKKGVDAGRLKTAGYGSLNLKQATIDEANRRVEIKILKSKK